MTREPILNRVHARCGKRVLVSGPEAAPATMRWVDSAARHRSMLGFKTAICSTSERAAYEQVVAEHLNSRIEESVYAD